MSLATHLAPCGPVLDAAAAERLREVLAKAALKDGWADLLETAWPGLAPIAAASPYLAGLMRRPPERVWPILRVSAEDRMAQIFKACEAVSSLTPEAGAKALRGLKADAHLTIGLADLGGVWGLDQVTGAITDFADAAVQATSWPWASKPAW